MRCSPVVEMGLMLSCRTIVMMSNGGSAHGTWLVQGWFPYDKELWGPNVLEQSLASGDMVRFFLWTLFAQA